MIGLLQKAFAALSVALMGLCGAQLLARLAHVVRGQETADGLPVNGIAEPLGKQEASTALAAPAGRRASGGAHARALLTAAGVTLLSRLAMYAIAYAFYRLYRVGDAGFWPSFQRLWRHWDTGGYLDIARNGYTAVGDERLELVFFPLYPLLMRLASLLTDGDVFAGGILVSLTCASLCGALLYDLCRMQWDEKVARLSLAYFLLNPLSVFLGCVYTEPLFICLTLAAVWLLRRGHGWWAALCGAASAFTRMPGVIIAGLFLIRLLGEIPRGKANARAALTCFLQMGVVFAGLAAYWLVNYAVTGDPFMYITYQWENWYQKAGSFWNSVSTTVYYTLTFIGSSNWLYLWAFQWFSMFYVFVLLAWRSGRLPFDLAAYAFVYTAVVLSPTWLLSGARYLFAMVPLPMLQARAHRIPLLHALTLAISGTLFLIWIYGFTIAAQVL